MPNTDQFQTFARRHSDSLIEVVATRLDALHGDVQDLKTSQREMTSAFQKLLVIEERQTEASASLERAFVALAKTSNDVDAVEKRVDSLERDAPMQKQTSNWVVSAVWGAAILAVTIIAKKFGII
jgi:hypothetical protein